MTDISAHIREADTRGYRQLVEGACAQTEQVRGVTIPTAIVGGIMSRESGCGLLLSPPGPAGTGDRGHGRGLMQIDDRWHTEWVNTSPWHDPATNIGYGVRILADIYREVRHRLTDESINARDLMRISIAGYNCGGLRAVRGYRAGDVDRFTSGGNYSADVLSRSAAFRRAGW